MINSSLQHPIFFFRRILGKHGVSLLIIGLLYLAVYNIPLFTPYFFSDDWWNLHFGLNKGEICPAWDTLRPLQFCWNLFLIDLLGINPTILHLVNLITNLFMGVTLYYIFSYFIPNEIVFVTLFVVLFAVFPADLSHTWYVLANVRITFIIFFLSILFLIQWLTSPGWWAYVCSIVLLLISLLMYEAHIGLALVAPVFLWIKTRPREWSKRVALIGLIILTLAFSLLRTFAIKWLGIAIGNGYEINGDSFSILEIISRLVTGYRLLFQWSWAEVLRRLLPILESSSSNISIFASLFFYAVLAGLAFVIFLLNKRAPKTSRGKEFSGLGDWKFVVFLIATGLLLVGLGYFPFVLAWGPWLGFYASRINILPSIGAALTFLSAIKLLAMFISSNKRSVTLSVAVLSIFLISIGIISQLLVEKGAVRAWEEQKSVWNQMFTLAPEFSPDSSIYLLIVPPAPSETYTPLAFSDGPSGQGLSYALKLFYNDDSLKGISIDQASGSLKFTDSGVVRPWGIDKYDQMILFRYDRQSKQLSISSQFPEGLLGGDTPSGYAPEARITKTGISKFGFRELVK